jgi:methionyl-tRNA synthetase
MTRVLSAVAWPYANGPRHIGHVAGFGVPSDVFSRFMRMAGHDVLMVSGPTSTALRSSSRPTRRA